MQPQARTLPALERNMPPSLQHQAKPSLPPHTHLYYLLPKNYNYGTTHWLLLNYYYYYYDISVERGKKKKTNQEKKADLK